LNIIESRNVPTFRQYTFLLFLRRLAGLSNSAGRSVAAGDLPGRVKFLVSVGPADGVSRKKCVPDGLDLV
jgi:hypothetical protein